VGGALKAAGAIHDQGSCRYWECPQRIPRRRRGRSRRRRFGRIPAALEPGKTLMPDQWSNFGRRRCGGARRLDCRRHVILLRL
jgi:hypothetical protein